jgi:hypothetical protein
MNSPSHTIGMKVCRRALAGVLLLAATVTSRGALAAEDSSAIDPYRQSRDDAWWTGPILAAGASTLPQGHSLVEPYFFNVISRGRYDENGTRHRGPRRHSYGSLTYLLYGLTDNVTVGVIPRFGYNDVSVGLDSSAVGLGDFTVQAAYRLATFREGGLVPTMSVVLQQTLPTGKYDRLGARPSDGLGTGAYTTTVALYSQYFFWMPNGRILRTRLNFSYAIPDTVTVEDVSVYGTGEGFRGHAKPGRSFVAGSAVEYSATRNWVLALDFVYQHDTATRLDGSLPTRVAADFGSSEVFTLAPAVEYNWNSRMGVIVGAVFTAAGRNASANVVPVVAVNMVF